VTLPRGGKAFVSVRDADKSELPELGDELVKRGFTLVATGGTAKVLKEAGLDCEVVNKVHEGRPHIVDMLKNGEISLTVNSTEGRQSINESNSIRSTALQQKVTYFTTMTAGLAAVRAIDYLDAPTITSLNELHAGVKQV
jgi:carbamoyl-phosphate synthase large subunit